MTGNTWRKVFCTNALSSDVRCETFEILVICSVDMNPLCLYPQLEEGIRVTVVEDLWDNFNLMNSSLWHLLYEELSLINNIDDLDSIPLKENMIFIPYSKFCQIILKKHWENYCFSMFLRKYLAKTRNHIWRIMHNRG